MRIFALGYGILGYLLFNASLLYFIGFIGNIVVPKTIDTGPEVPILQAFLVDTLLIILFGLQHSVMARPWFKRIWLTLIPIPIERSTYVLLSSIAILLLCGFWQPLPQVIWQVENSIGSITLWALFWFGWLFSLYATFLIDHFDLMGVRQVYLYWRGIPYTSVPFQVRTVYNYIRHPIMLGTLIGMWATPMMSVGHLWLSIGFSLYILIGSRLEERDMKNVHGEFYENYRQKTSMIVPSFFKRRG
jgi:methanethiol S-methyltransferase